MDQNIPNGKPNRTMPGHDPTGPCDVTTSRDSVTFRLLSMLSPSAPPGPSSTKPLLTRSTFRTPMHRFPDMVSHCALVADEQDQGVEHLLPTTRSPARKPVALAPLQRRQTLLHAAVPVVGTP